VGAGESGGGRPPAQPVVLATVGRPHGLDGELGIRRFNPESTGLEAGRLVWVDGAGIAGRWLRVQSRRGEYLRLEGIGRRTDAEALRGARLSVDRASLPEPSAGEFYLHDLLGCQVFDAAGRGLGTLAGVQVGGTREYFVVKGAREVLLPTDASLVAAVDLDAATMHLNVEVEPEEEKEG
jgi:16S rRNA processing protein RimM